MANETEPTIEEILASIRRIIAEEQESSPAAGAAITSTHEPLSLADLGYHDRGEPHADLFGSGEQHPDLLESAGEPHGAPRRSFGRRVDLLGEGREPLGGSPPWDHDPFGDLGEPAHGPRPLRSEPFDLGDHAPLLEDLEEGVLELGPQDRLEGAATGVEQQGAKKGAFGRVADMLGRAKNKMFGGRAAGEEATAAVANTGDAAAAATVRNAGNKGASTGGGRSGGSGGGYGGGSSRSWSSAVSREQSLFEKAIYDAHGSLHMGKLTAWIAGACVLGAMLQDHMREQEKKSWLENMQAARAGIAPSDMLR